MTEVEFRTEDSGIIAVYNQPVVPDVGEHITLYGKEFLVINREWHVRKDEFVEGNVVIVIVTVAPVGPWRQTIPT